MRSALPRELAEKPPRLALSGKALLSFGPFATVALDSGGRPF